MQHKDILLPLFYETTTQIRQIVIIFITKTLFRKPTSWHHHCQPTKFHLTNLEQCIQLPIFKPNTNIY